jgi:beta-phosphoglucomutase-like phosphatase (HAD superfamily)
MELNAVIFDLDGTLIDSMGIWKNVDIEYLKKRGIVSPNKADACIMALSAKLVSDSRVNELNITGF